MAASGGSFGIKAGGSAKVVGKHKVLADSGPKGYSASIKWKPANEEKTDRHGHLEVTDSKTGERTTFYNPAALTARPKFEGLTASSPAAAKYAEQMHVDLIDAGRIKSGGTVAIRLTGSSMSAYLVDSKGAKIAGGRHPDDLYTFARVMGLKVAAPAVAKAFAMPRKAGVLETIKHNLSPVTPAYHVNLSGKFSGKYGG